MKSVVLLCLAALSLCTLAAGETLPINTLSSGPSVETDSSDVAASEDRSKRHLLKAKLGLLGLGLLGGGIVGAKLGAVGGTILGAKLASGGGGGYSGGWGGRSSSWGGDYQEGGSYYGGGGYSQSYAPSYPTSSNVVYHHYHETAPQVQIQPQAVHHHHEHHHVEHPQYQQPQVVHQHHHVQEPHYHVQQPQYQVAQPSYHYQQPQVWKENYVEQYQQPSKVWSPPVDNCVQGW